MLKYVGNGSFLPGVPARDLSDEEASKFGEEGLIKSGLYKREIQIHKEFKRQKEKEGDS
jgi:hypothetical protein